MKKLVLFLSLMCLVCITAIILMLTGVIKTNISDCSCPDSLIPTVEESELLKIKSGDYNIIKILNTKNNTINLLTNGKVNFDLDRELSNIENAKDIAMLNNYLYILTKDGDVYKYYLGITKKATLEADKIDDVNNVKSFVNYSSRRSNAGGCDYIVGILGNGKYITIDEMCI